MRQKGGDVMGSVLERELRASMILEFGFVAFIGGLVGMLMLSLVLAFGEAVAPAATASATATPPRNGSIRTWAADGHWWVVGDGWGQHHPGCPCGNKAEVEAP
jgi:hypothetical protein